MSKKTAQTIGRNTVSGRALLEIIERLERIDEQKEDLKADERLIIAEAEAAGFDKKTIGSVRKYRRANPADVEEAQARFDMYLHAIGMARETPLFRAVGMMNVDVAARDEVIDAFKLLVPQSGEIIVKIGSQPVRLWRDEDGIAHAEDVVDKPAPASRPQKSSGLPERPQREVPDVDEDGARELGATAYRSNQPITSNPFPWDDSRRAAFDRGWRVASGTDGMGPGEDD